MNLETNAKRSTQTHCTTPAIGTESAVSGEYSAEEKFPCTNRHTQSVETCGTAQSASMRRPVRLQLDRVSTPIGMALLVTDDRGVLRALDFQDYEPRMLRLLRSHY